MRCEICNKELEKNKSCRAYNKVLCAKHYQQFLKFGKALDSNPRTTKDLNDFIIEDDYVRVIMYNQNCKETGEFLIDKADMEEVLKKKWRLWKGRVFTGNYHPISIHQFLMHPKKGEVVDHINGNPLDNRRENLRITKQCNNVLNKALPSNNTSGIMGVNWNEDRKKYEVEIRKDGKRVKLSRYSDLCDAVYVRYVAETILFKEYRSNRNDAVIIPLVDKCQNKDKLYNYTKDKISQHFNI